jgi:hypothetical protein
MLGRDIVQLVKNFVNFSEKICQISNKRKDVTPNMTIIFILIGAET